MAKEGRKPKDSSLVPNLDKKNGVSKRSLDAAIRKKKQELRDARKKARVDGRIPDAAPRPKKDSDEDRMLADMWWVYKNAEFVDPQTKKKMSGRQKLLQLVQSDDRQYLFMVKELLRIEAQRKERGGGGGEQKTVFVVLKGLYDEEVDDAKMETGVDHKQIMAAIDPSAEVQREAQEDDEFGWLKPEDQK